MKGLDRRIQFKSCRYRGLLQNESKFDREKAWEQVGKKTSRLGARQNRCPFSTKIKHFEQSSASSTTQRRVLKLQYDVINNFPEEDFDELLASVCATATAHGVALVQQKEFHVSLSQTVILRHHWIQPFTQLLSASAKGYSRFMCSAQRLRVYTNAEKTRTFLGMEVTTGQVHLLELIKLVDKIMMEFSLDTFYKNPSFHVSLAWCIGNFSEHLQKCLQQLQHLVDDHEDGAFWLKLDCHELHCRAGNKVFSFSLKT